MRLRLLLLLLVPQAVFGRREAFAMQGADNQPAFVTYAWPLGPGQAVQSDVYAVRLSDGTGWTSAPVLMSRSWDEPGGGPDVFRHRTFSWASFSSGFHRPITIEVTKLTGDAAERVEVFPSRYGIRPTLSDSGRTVRFTLNRSRYVSVNFVSPDNKSAPGGIIRNMLMIFADPPEAPPPATSVPNTISFTQDTTPAEIDRAQTLYFAPGYYDLHQEIPDGILRVHSRQTIYLAGGAFVVGKILGAHADDVVVRGRGVISGRDWHWHPGLPISALIRINGRNTQVEGIIACDNDMHGVVPGDNVVMRNVKMWGWHYNNDGFRPQGGLVEHCFLRPADDAFYVGRDKLTVTDTVIWQSFNGAVVTCGWGHPQHPYDMFDFTMRDCDILYPEWNSRGNNNGLLASQLPYDAKSGAIRFLNVRIDGNVVALTNLKRNMSQPRVGLPGGIRNILFQNVVITGRQLEFSADRRVARPSRSLIAGDGGFRISDVEFDDVRIGGVLLTPANEDKYFEIDPATTDNIRFSATHVKSEETP